MDETNEEVPAKRSRFPMAIVVPVVTLLLGAGGGYAAFTFLGGKGEPAAPAAEGAAPAGEHGAAAAPAGEHGGAAAAAGAVVAAVVASGPTLTNLGTMTVNLRGSGGGRVLRVEVQVESDGRNAEALAARTPQMRDSVITAVSDYTWSELEGTDGKTRLRDELLARVNGVTSPAVVERLYFTQFVVQ